MVEAVYTLTEKEFMEAQRVWCPQVARRVTGYWLMQITGGIFGACFGWSLRYQPAPLIVASILSFCLVLVIGQWRKKAARKYQYQFKIETLGEISVHFDAEGYRGHTGNTCGGWINWGGFSGWRETPRIFVLGHGVAFVAVPKRSFSTEQQEQLRDLLARNIRNSD